MDGLLGGTPQETPQEPVVPQEVPQDTPQDAVASPDNDFASFIPDEYKNEKCFENYKTKEDLFKSHVNLEKMIGQKRHQLPTAESTPEEWAEFNKAMGVPEKADAYNLGLKDAEGNDLPVEQTAWVRDMAHEAGLRQDQLSKVLEHYGKQEQSFLEQQKQAEAQKPEQAMAYLNEKYGLKTQDVLNDANKIANTLGLDQMILDANLQNEPAVYEMLHKVKAFISNDVLKEGKTANDAMTNIDDRIKNLQRTDGFYKRNHPNHKSLHSEYDQLIQQAVTMKQR